MNIELWWLLKGLKPSFRSIAYFRKDNAAALKEAFRYFVVLLQDMELIEGQTIAIDSFRIRAQNSIRNNYNQKKIDRHIGYIDAKLAFCRSNTYRYGFLQDCNISFIGQGDVVTLPGCY